MVLNTCSLKVITFTPLIVILLILERHSYFSFGHVTIGEKIRNKEEISIMLPMNHEERTLAYLLYTRINGAVSI